MSMARSATTIIFMSEHSILPPGEDAAVGLSKPYQYLTADLTTGEVGLEKAADG